MAARITTLLLAIVIATLAMAAQAATNDCASKLIGCAAYINSTATPPETCCGPMKEAAATQMPCLCAIFNDPDILKNFNVNVTKAIQMASRCGVTANKDACSNNGTAPGSSPGGSSAPSSTSSDTGSPSVKNPNSAHGITRLGFSGPIFLLLCWWSLVA